jgi:hypothetical protein
MNIAVFVPSIITIVLTGLAAIAWIVLIGGFGASNTQTGVFEVLATASPSQKEITLINLNPYFIVAVLSPFLFILMIVKSILLMVLKRQMTYISVIMSNIILFLAVFVLIAGGGVFQRTSTSITHSRVADITTNDNTSAEFTGMFLETVSLVGGLLALHSATILSAKTQDSEEITVSENENEKENEKPA